MYTMSQTEAAEEIATATVVYAREHGLIGNCRPDKDLVEARISELCGTAEPGTYLHIAAMKANWRTTLRLLEKCWM